MVVRPSRHYEVTKMLKNLACLQPKLNNLFYPPNKGDYVYFESTPQFQYPIPRGLPTQPCSHMHAIKKPA